MERFTQKESTYYEKALIRLQELENKIENKELVPVDIIADTLNTVFCEPCGESIIDEYMQVKCDDWCEACNNTNLSCYSDQPLKCWKKFLQTRVKELQGDN